MDNETGFLPPHRRHHPVAMEWFAICNGGGIIHNQKYGLDLSNPFNILFYVL